MPRGGARPGAGAPLGNRNRARRIEAEPSGDMPPRPTFETGRDFAIWALNASDAEAPMEVKIRAMQALVALEGKQPAPGKANDPAEVAETAMGGRYAPRKVRGFGVVDGGR